MLGIVSLGFNFEQIKAVESIRFITRWFPTAIHSW